MSLSDFLTPEDRAGVPWAGCLHCHCREHCTHYQNNLQIETLLRAARQGRAAAQYLQEETGRFRQTVSCAETVDALLSASNKLEDALTQILRAEVNWLGDLSSS